MKVITQDVYGSADVLELRDLPIPQVEDDDVLIRIHAAGIDPGVWHLMTGKPCVVRLMGFGFRAPKSRIRGSDMAGRVEAVGAHVTRFEPGDEVFGTCDGSFAEYALAHENTLALKPLNLTFAQAAVVPTSGMTALQGLRDKGRIESGQRVLIIGAVGGVGSFAVQLARAFGAHVTGMCSTTKAELVRSIGADDVVDYTREDLADSNRRYDLILDTAGNRRLSHLRRALTKKGTLVMVGAETGGRWLGGTDRLLCALVLSPFVSQHLRGLISTARREDLLFLAELIEAGKLTPVIDRTYALHDVPEAVRYLEQGHARGKVVITV